VKQCLCRLVLEGLDHKFNIVRKASYFKSITRWDPAVIRPAPRGGRDRHRTDRGHIDLPRLSFCRAFESGWYSIRGPFFVLKRFAGDGCWTAPTYTAP
jgi:hypothetical protein